MDRVVSLASELMIGVVKACVESQYGCWNAKDTTVQGLTNLATRCFTWPRGVTQATFNILKLEAAEALIKTSIVTIPMVFSAQHTVILPPLLVERRDDLRHLSLQLHTTPMDGSYNRELNKGIKSMTALGDSFPNLEVLVLSLYLHSTTQGHQDLQRFQQEVLRMRNVRRVSSTSGWGHATIEDTVVEFIATFAQSGPGRRKLIRFANLKNNRRDHVIGPLVKVNNPVERVCGQAIVRKVDEEVNGEEDDPAITNARHIFNQAYNAPRVARCHDLVY